MILYFLKNLFNFSTPNARSLFVLGFIFSHASVAKAKTCTEFLQPSQIQKQSYTSTVDMYDQAYLLSRSGQFEESLMLLSQIREHITSTPISKILPGKYGSHGAYKAELEDGTLVLVKPFADDLYSCIPKEVGMSKLFDLIGLPIIPVAGYRTDPKTNNLASVHLFLSNSRSQNFLTLMTEVFSSVSERSYQGRRDVFGSEINFIFLITEYAKVEMSQRHVLRRILPDATEVKYLIDMGSALLTSPFDLPAQNELEYFRIPQNVIHRIQSLTIEDFHLELAPYFPHKTTQALYNRLQLIARALDQPSNYDEIRRAYLSENYHNMYYSVQKWNWPF